MESILEVLYCHWYESHWYNIKKNTQEYMKVYDLLDEKTFDAVFDCIIAETKISFQAGFQTAVQLLLSGNKL